MKDSASFALRGLLTDTLPYEVPTIFSNEGWHANLASTPSTPRLKAILGNIGEKTSKFSKPYDYEIVKGQGRFTRLSIIHPIWQNEIARFLNRHADDILSYCDFDAFSLRRPVSLASPFAFEPPEDPEESALKFGVCQVARDQGEPDVSHMTSFFAYRRYNLLGKFVGSREHLRLERRYKYERKADISKCFYNIYTHSIGWAIKGKAFTKSNHMFQSFEAAFDNLMQSVNYNETNGIVVGPEISRIFAEIILQDVDKSIISQMQSKGYSCFKEFEIRRYIDDFYIYANSVEALDSIEESLRKSAERYKLFLNPSKSETQARPFVSKLSMARRKVESELKAVSDAVRRARETGEQSDLRWASSTIRRALETLRVIVRDYQIGFETISGWLFSRFRRLIRDLLYWQISISEADVRVALSDMVVEVVHVAMHVTALDVRVRTTYSLSQLAQILRQNRSRFSDEQWGDIELSFIDGVTAAGSQMVGADKGDEREPIELYNLLICGVDFLGSSFLSDPKAEQLVRAVQEHAASYFGYISLKFLYLSDESKHKAELSQINSQLKNRILGGINWRTDSEEFFLICAFLSSPDISISDKRDVFLSMNVGNSISNAELTELGHRLSFVDWRGLSLEHLLARKTLRPVYAWG